MGGAGEDDFGQRFRPGPLARAKLALWVLAERVLPPAQDAGAWGERWAARLLRACGCAILERNARPTRRGEIDLVARRRGVVLFVEVKTRGDERLGRPLDAVDARKRGRLRKAAAHWLAQHRLQEAPHRFDAVEVVGAPGRRPALRWVQRLRMPRG